MCCSNGLLFDPKSFNMGSILAKKILRRGSHFTKIATKKKKKKCWISHFWGRKTPTNGSQLTNILKKLSNQLFFWGRKILSLDMGMGFRPRAAHHSSKNNPTPPAKIQVCCKSAQTIPATMMSPVSKQDWNHYIMGGSPFSSFDILGQGLMTQFLLF